MGASVTDFMAAELTTEQVEEVLGSGELDMAAVVEKYLWDGRTFMRRNASIAVRLSGEMAAEKTNLLAVAAKDADAIVRENSLGALAKVDIDPSEALAPLLKGLGDPDESVRLMARETMDLLADRFGEEIIPSLIDALADPRGFVQMAVVEVLLRFQEKAAQPLVDALTHGQQEVAFEVYRTLKRLGMRAADALIGALSDMERRRSAAELMMLMPELPEEQIEAIKELTESEDKEVAELAAAVLETLRTAKKPEEPPPPIEIEGFHDAALDDEALEAAAEEEVPVASLLVAIRDSREPVRVNAAALLGLQAKKLEPDDLARVAFALSALARDDAPAVRGAVSKALAQLDHPDALPPLILGVTDKIPEVAEVARLGLIAVGPTQAAPLLDLLTAEQPSTCQSAILDALVAAGKEAVPALSTALAEASNPVARQIAAAAMKWIGKDAADGVEALKGALGDNVEAVRRTAALALAFVAEPDEPVLEALKKAARDGDLSVRKAASEARARLTGTYVEPIATVESEPIAIDGFEERELTEEDIGEAAGEIGVEPLVRALDDGRPVVRHNAAVALATLKDGALDAQVKLGVVAKDADAAVRKAVMGAFGALGPKAAEVSVPALATALADSDAAVVETARGALEALGGDALDGLIGALDNDPELAQKTALPALAGLGKDAVKPLTAALEALSPRVRANAVRALGMIGADAASAAEALISRLKDEADDVRGLAAFSLGKIGDAQESVLEALKAARKDGVGAVRQAVAFAYDTLTGALDEPEPPAPIELDGFEERELTEEDVAGAAGDIGVERLVVALGDGRHVVRHNAALALASLKDTAVDAGQALTVVAKDADAAVRKAAATALGALGAKAAGVAVPALVPGLADPDPDVAEAARGAVDALGKGALEATVGTLDMYYDMARRTAIPVLTGHGKAAVKPLLPALEALSPRVRANAASTLGLIGADAASAAEPLAAALKDEADDVRRAAATALGALGVDKEPVLEALKAARRDGVAGVRRAAALAYDRLTGALEEPEVLDPIEVDGFEEKLLTAKEIAKDAKKIGADRFVHALRDGRPIVRHNAAVALGTLGAKAAEAASSLALLARDADPAVRAAVSTSFGELGGDVAEISIPALARAMSDADESVVEAAKAALEAIGADALPALMKELEGDPDRVATTVLPAIVAFGEKAIEPLTGCLDHLMVPVRLSAVRALGMLGTEFADDTREAAEKMTNDEADAVKKAAKEAVDRIDGKEPPPVYFEELKLPDPFYGGQLNLGDAKKAAKGVDVELFRKAMFDGREIVRQNVLRGIAGLGKKAAELTEELLLALKDGNPMVRVAAAEALGDLKLDPERAAYPMALALHGAEERQQETILKSLDAYGKAVVEPLMEALALHQFDVVPAIGPVAKHMAKDVVGPITKRLTREYNPVIRDNAAEVLAAIGRGAAKAEKALVEAVEETDLLLRVKFIQAIGKCCILNKKLFDMLDEMMRTDERYPVHDAIREAKMYLAQPDQ